MTQEEKLQLDYEDTLCRSRMMADTPFMLLALASKVIGIAVALRLEHPPNKTSSD